jgi:NAD(P)-dependent dehydrogenase (short-subunit alcohol dehydrogenase family)
MKLKGRIAMVTGGASGMGRAMALAFAREGASLAIGSLTRRATQPLAGEITNLLNPEALEQVKMEVEAIGASCLALELDVTSRPSVEEFVKATMGRYGRVDILANAAGMTCEQAIEGHDDALWQRVLDVNLTGTYRCIKAVIPVMKKNRWGRIINIASTAANVGGKTNGAYCAAKAGVVALTRCVALEGADYGISANAICPAWVDTTFGKKWMTDIAVTERVSAEAKVQEIVNSYPQKRLITPEEVGNLALFLALDDSFGVSGQDLTISGAALW